MKISPARVAAFDVLLRIETEQAFSSVLLPAIEDSLSPQDRSLCHELVLGSLRKQIYLDRVISSLTKDRKIDVEVRVALRLAIYQLKFLDRIPPHSAVNESVNLVQRAKKSSARPFVNGVLRRLLRENIEIRFTDDLDRLSVETSHPRWLLERWARDFGPGTADGIAKANNAAPPISFRLLEADPLLESEITGFARPSEHVQGCYIAAGPQHRLVELAKAGKIYFQDEGSQMVADSIDVEDGQRVLDLCASPGGKTGMIAQRASKSGLVIAGDISRRRVELLKDNCLRQGVTLGGIVQYDAQNQLPFTERFFDRVLVDAPCSGTGTIRHNPEIRYSFKPEELPRLADKQLSILVSASEMVRPGGQLVYSTCSLETEENEAVCNRFFTGSKDFESVAPRVSSRFIVSDRYARTRPDRDGMDGFFIAAFRRRS